jgi:hypothetical protein
LHRLSGRRFIGITVTVAVIAWIIGMLPSTLASWLGSAGSASTSATEPPLVLIVLAGAAGGAVAGAVFGGAQAWALRIASRDGVATRAAKELLDATEDDRGLSRERYAEALLYARRRDG